MARERTDDQGGDPRRDFERAVRRLKKDFQRIRFYLNILSPGSLWIDDVNIDGPDGNSLVPCTR